MKMIRAGISITVVCLVLVLSLAGCSERVAPPPAQANAPAGGPQGLYELRSDKGVDVVYFEESNACDCMAETGAVIKDAVNTYFAEELQSGKLRFFVVLSDDWTNRETFEVFNNQPFDLFVVEFLEPGHGVATPVNEFWSMMGDNEAIDLFVKARVEESLSKLG